MSSAFLSARIELRVPFHDADPAGMVWHGHYLKYFELARCELLERFDYNYPQMARSGYVWPVVDLRVRYSSPVHYNQRLTVTAALEEFEYRLRIAYRVCDDQGRTCCEGRTDQVPVRVDTGELELGVPTAVIARIDAAIAEGDEG